MSNLTDNWKSIRGMIDGCDAACAKGQKLAVFLQGLGPSKTVRRFRDRRDAPLGKISITTKVGDPPNEVECQMVEFDPIEMKRYLIEAFGTQLRLAGLL